MKPVDITGRRFGMLQVLAMTRVGTFAGCICRCDCGKQKTIAWRSIKAGEVRSCGCLASARIAAANLTHGDCVGAPSYEWITWRSMRQRCTDPKHKSYQAYGGRGIRVCERWESFANFLADMGRRPSLAHSIDRYPNNDGNYEPTNCRWATATEQANNRRKRA